MWRSRKMLKAEVAQLEEEVAMLRSSDPEGYAAGVRWVECGFCGKRLSPNEGAPSRGGHEDRWCVCNRCRGKLAEYGVR